MPVWLHHADPDYVNYQNYLKTFSNDRFLIVAFEVPDAFGAEQLSFVSKLSADLLKLPQVEKVDSLTTVQNIESRGDDLVTEGLFESLPTDSEQIKHRKAIALNDDNIRNILVSEDGLVTALYLRLNVDAGVTAANQLLSDVEAVVKTHNQAHYQMHAGGPPATDSGFRTTLKKRSANIFTGYSFGDFFHRLSILPELFYRTHSNSHSNPDRHLYDGCLFFDGEHAERGDRCDGTCSGRRLCSRLCAFHDWVLRSC